MDIDWQAEDLKNLDMYRAPGPVSLLATDDRGSAENQNYSCQQTLSQNNLLSRPQLRRIRDRVPTSSLLRE